MGDLEKAREFPKWNHYRCQQCGGITIARHDDDGVTPFMIRCRAKDTIVDGKRIRGCNASACSNFFAGSQADDQRVDVVFFRPANVMDAIQAINREPARYRRDLLEHYRQGGALMKNPDGSRMGNDG